MIRAHLDPHSYSWSTQTAPGAMTMPVVERIDVLKAALRCKEWATSGHSTPTIPGADLLHFTLD